MYGYLSAISPSTKKVAFTPRRSSSLINNGVDFGSGPSSKVSATLVEDPVPKRYGHSDLLKGGKELRAGKER